ncbi:hypothetical protein [Microbacterium schleiferi]|uniref:hypothetical protein n=1 Tax=Microbacterium schleiferi TaxID=69362 RepID=UPI001D1730BC|nr:hypothetical protein [Microbacterium schleiferi]MCC4266231.1 hypothetical protein [Microbacterium schleiferi]
MNRRAAIATVALAAITLTGCATTTPEDFADAWDTCVSAYGALPRELDVLAEQNPGTKVDRETPCENWVESQGEDGFVDFWGDPDEYMDFVVSAAKVDALASLQDQ